MISVERAWSRLKDTPLFHGFKLSNFRFICYGQSFTLAAGATSSTQQTFPGGAVVLGIAASAAISGGVNANAFTPRHSFALNFAYTGGESITPGGPINADALMGGGDETHFPAKELVIAPTQGLLVGATNLDSTATLAINIAYHCLVWRFAS